MNIDLINLEEISKRNENFRICINHKIFDTSHEDDMAKYIINSDKWKDKLVIRYEYYISKTYHGMGRGDLALMDDNNIYIIELKSLKDKYSSTTDSSKIKKCEEQSIKYYEYAKSWAKNIDKTIIPITVIEYENGKIIENIIINYDDVDDDDADDDVDVVDDDLDRWFKHPGDQTPTLYKINGNKLEVVRTIDYEPSAGSRRALRKRAKRIASDCTDCVSYSIVMKNIEGTIILDETYNIN
jgi:hypothetical protein